jgi:predicted negative regulator of RcsB-dependent stress response
MEVYNSEEEQVEALKRWWKANGTSVITGIIAGLAIIGGWNFWQSNQEQKAFQSSAMFQQLTKAAGEKNTEVVEKVSEQLITEYGSTTYAELALLIQAKAKVQQDDLSAAKDILNKVRETSDSEIKHVATIRLLRLMLATSEYEQGLQLIAEMEKQSSESFSASYEELKGDLYVALNRPGVARTAYQNALRAGQTSPLLQVKLDNISAPELLEIKE